MLAELARALAPTGMSLRGGFTPREADGVPLLRNGQRVQTLLLVGNVGGAMWLPFAASGALQRFPDNPLDRWTVEVLEPIAATLGIGIVYPFSGPPYYPFQRWSTRAEALDVSPLRIFIHPLYGLWHAYRAAFLLADPVELPARASTDSPCHSCADRPCLSACPVNAFTPAAFDDRACAQHVDGPEGDECRLRGCLARRACPVGRDYSYPTPQMAFHMEAFLKPRRLEPKARLDD